MYVIKVPSVRKTCLFYPIYLFILYLLNHVLLSIWTHVCLFCALAYNLMLRCFVAQIVPPGALRSFELAPVSLFFCLFQVYKPMY